VGPLAFIKDFFAFAGVWRVHERMGLSARVSEINRLGVFNISIGLRITDWTDRCLLHHFWSVFSDKMIPRCCYRAICWRFFGVLFVWNRRSHLTVSLRGCIPYIMYKPGFTRHLDHVFLLSFCTVPIPSLLSVLCCCAQLFAVCLRFYTSSVSTSDFLIMSLPFGSLA
jgi:hypothetical protein